MKLVAVDVGNTSVSGSIYERSRWGRSFRFATHAPAAARRLAILKALKGVDSAVPVLIGSVVPGVGQSLKKILLAEGFSNSQLLGVDMKLPIENCYKNPKQVGIDRLLNALAAFKRYHRRLIVIDFGTAITFDVVGSRGEYLGGVIAPGIEITLDALFQRTALLPKTKLKHVRSAVGRDTVESIRIGSSVGIGGLCDRIVEVIAKETGKPGIVVATGGYAPFMKKYCRSIDAIHENLIFEGILETFRLTDQTRRQ